MSDVLSQKELQLLDAYWRAANYLSVGQIYLLDNPLLLEGTTTTPFDMVMLNDLDRLHLVVDVVDRVPGLAATAAHLRQEMVDRRLEARAWTRARGDDDPAIRDWTWPH